MEQVHLLIKNAKVFNSYLKKFISANVAVKDGKFYYIDRKQDTDLQTDNVIDAKGSYMIPGLTDIHMHIESSMATPAFFGKCAGENGVTTVVSEPHEMANVKGIRGVLEMISAAKNAPIDIFYGIPSSIPPVSRPWKRWRLLCLILPIMPFWEATPCVFPFLSVCGYTMIL